MSERGADKSTHNYKFQISTQIKLKNHTKAKNIYYLLVMEAGIHTSTV